MFVPRGLAILLASALFTSVLCASPRRSPPTPASKSLPGRPKVFHNESYFLNIFSPLSSFNNSFPPVVNLPSLPPPPVPDKPLSPVDYELNDESRKIEHALQLYHKEQEILIGLLPGHPGEKGPLGEVGAAEDYAELVMQLKELQHKMSFLMTQHSRAKQLEKELSPTWHTGSDSCPDSWKRVGFFEERVHCRPPRRNISPGNERCRFLATFPKHYDRCGWSLYCQAPWKHYDCFNFLPEQIAEYEEKERQRKKRKPVPPEEVNSTALLNPGDARSTPLFKRPVNDTENGPHDATAEHTQHSLTMMDAIKELGPPDPPPVKDPVRINRLQAQELARRLRRMAARRDSRVGTEEEIKKTILQKIEEMLTNLTRAAPQHTKPGSTSRYQIRKVELSLRDIEESLRDGLKDRGEFLLQDNSRIAVLASRLQDIAAVNSARQFVNAQAAQAASLASQAQGGVHQKVQVMRQNMQQLAQVQSEIANISTATAVSVQEQESKTAKLKLLDIERLRLEAELAMTPDSEYEQERMNVRREISRTMKDIRSIEDEPGPKTPFELATTSKLKEKVEELRERLKPDVLEVREQQMGRLQTMIVSLTAQREQQSAQERVSTDVAISAIKKAQVVLAEEVQLRKHARRVGKMVSLLKQEYEVSSEGLEKEQSKESYENMQRVWQRLLETIRLKYGAPTLVKPPPPTAKTSKARRRKGPKGARDEDDDDDSPSAKSKAKGPKKPTAVKIVKLVKSAAQKKLSAAKAKGKTRKRHKRRKKRSKSAGASPASATPKPPTAQSAAKSATAPPPAVSKPAAAQSPSVASSKTNSPAAASKAP